MNKSDKILIIILVIILLVVFLLKIIFKTDSTYANVYYENNIIKTIDLTIDATYTVEGYNGDVVIEVLDNKIRVTEENSPLHICSKQGWVSDGTPIICLPNKIIIKIENNSDLDTISR
ncbi:MAG TPA: NusG domain II-containing protein [Bacilli bacterium]|nr:NusG domain II-containing protein [Bacilli bacterium]